MKEQTECNDGGLYRSLVTLSWSDGWLEDAEMTRDQITGGSAISTAEIEEAVQRIDEAERVYWSCTPAARETATTDHPFEGDWLDVPSWYEEHATYAERADAGGKKL